jgi:LmbE family N-acetylglucosaminyl deacetylase
MIPEAGGRAEAWPITTSRASEDVWRSAFLDAASPLMQWGTPGRVVVVAPHPDDEVLAVGGSMLQLAKRGFSVLVVAVTDGEAAQPHAPADARRRLAAVRSRERRMSLESLGLAGVSVVRACIPDGRVEQSEARLTDLLVELLSDPRSVASPLGHTWCIAPWRHDGHPDHEATGRAAAAACAISGGRLVEYLVWAWQWLRPEDGRMRWADLRLERLSRATQDAKRVALGAFSSQILPWEGSGDPILSAEMLERFARPFEGFVLEDEHP